MRCAEEGLYLPPLHNPPPLPFLPRWDTARGPGSSSTARLLATSFPTRLLLSRSCGLWLAGRLPRAGPGQTASTAGDLTVLLSTVLPSGELLHVTPGSHALRDDCTPKRHSGSCTTRTHGLNAALSHALTTFSSCTPAQDSVQSVAQTLVSLTHSSHNSCNDIVVVTEFIT